MMTNHTRAPLLTLLAVFTITTFLHADMTCYDPALAVEMARDIAVGVVHVSHAKGLEVQFTPQIVLKGNMQPGGTYIVNYVNRGELRGVIEKIATHAEGKPAIMFLGYLNLDGKTLAPDSFDGAVWPRTTKEPMDQTPDTLGECILFVKALLANPKLKLKDVNGRRMLPDNYTLPTTPLAAVQPTDQMRYVTFLTPSRAVKSAEDIAVGKVQVSRINGLEVRFTPQTVLKGNMHPGDTYIVKYRHNYPSLREFLNDLAVDAEGKPAVMLLGRLWGDGKMLEPNSRDGAIWPRSAKWGGVFKTPDTLEGCITFVKALVANPGLKLKIVNDRQMLPDDYKLPAATKAP